MKRAYAFFTVLLFLVLAVSASAQVMPADEDQKSEAGKTQPAAVPESIKVEYRGGVYGFSDKAKGTIKFDDINERLVFYGEDGKEKFSIPFDAIAVVYPSQKKVQSGTGRTLGAIPLPGAAIGGMFLKKKKNYLVIQYSDPDVDVTGAANFLLDTGEELYAAIKAIGEKAELQPRGDAYIRKKSE